MISHAISLGDLFDVFLENKLVSSYLLKEKCLFWHFGSVVKQARTFGWPVNYLKGHFRNVDAKKCNVFPGPRSKTKKSAQDLFI